MNVQQNTISPSHRERILIEKIRSLSPEKFIELQDFVEFLSQKNMERKLINAGNKLAEDAFKKVWDNPEDAEYDRL